MWIITFLLASGLTFSTGPRELGSAAACEATARQEARTLNQSLGVPAVVGIKCEVVG